MGQYLSVVLTVNPGTSLITALQPLFRNDSFRPATLGGIASGSTHVFLGGWALEDFLARVSTRVTESDAVELAQADDPAERGYLAEVKAAIGKTRNWNTRLSPFEKPDPGVGVTFLHAPRLTDAELFSCRAWIERFPHGVVYLYGCTRVSVRDPAGHPWDDTFRLLVSRTKGEPVLWAPLLFIRAATPDIAPYASEIMFYSQWDIWLRGATAISGLVGAEEADRNLKTLAGIVQSVAATAGTQITSARLDMEGRSFEAERARLETALLRP